MGKNNRRRRAAKQRKRTEQRRERRTEGHPAAGGRRFDARSDADPSTAFLTAVQAFRVGDGRVVSELVELLAALAPAAVAAAVEVVVEREVARLWVAGWQPAVLHRAVERNADAGAAAVLRGALAAESASWETLAAEVAPEWLDQLATVGAGRSPSPEQSYLVRLDRSWPDVLHAAVGLTDVLQRLPALPLLGPPPTEWRSGMAAAAGRTRLPSAVLEKVRALLAKAESTSFDAEAEAFTAKAQELMTRHRIDRAVLEASSGAGSDTASGRRLLVDDPYADAKAMLLQAICEANDGRAVWSKGLGFSTVFAFPDELDIIEDLFTSLLVQATRALRREGTKQDGAGRSRTKRFRRSFLVAFATRIGQRLAEASDAVVAEAEQATGRSLVPVLAGRAEAAHDAAAEAFPETRRFAANASDGEGWFAGTMFGDRADLGVGASLDERSVS